MKKSTLTLFLAATALTLASCGSQPTSSASKPSSQPEAEPGTSESSSSENTTSETASSSDTSSGATSESANSIPQLTFTTTDLSGNEVTMDTYTDASVVMINFWEPWCGPCVGEMPELEKIYEAYQDQGLVILGAYTTTDDMEAVREIIEDNQITYPILVATEEFYPYMSQYVPTTVFLDGDGYLIYNQQVIGAKSYDEWEKLIVELLNR